MKSATYTPGHSEKATEFMARRTIESHGEFFLPYLTPGVSVLDCGCGPGSITLSIASRIGNGRVVGIDFGESQIQRAIEAAKDHGIYNAVFQQADCYSLPFEGASFDRIFSNALMEHLTDPVRAMRELLRVPPSTGSCLKEQSVTLPEDPPSPLLTFREGTSSDIDQLAEWNHQLIRDEGHRNRMTVPELAERMRGWLEQDYRAMVFELAGTPVAYALFREQPDEIYLRQLFVVRERRHQGIGKSAFELLRTKVWPTNKRLTVEVLTTNTAAVTFWRSMGFADYSLMLEILSPG